MEKTKILFTHNTAMWYRLPFFKQLAKIYDLDLVFTHINVISDVYESDISSKIKGLEDVDYTILDNSHGFARGLIKKAFADYDILIGGSWDTPQELIETIILFTITQIRKKPFIIWREDWDWPKKKNLKEKILEGIIKFLSNNASAILVPGSLHKSYFQNKIKVKPEKIFIMPNVSNITGFKKKALPTNKKKILYVGRLIPRKGVKYLLEAYEQLNISDTELIIIGTGPDEEKLK